MNKTVSNINKPQNDERSGKLKLYSIGSVIILIAIVIIVNVLFDKILGKALTFDFSDALSNTISQESIDYINGLPQDTKIRIVGLFDKPADVSGTEYQYICPLLDDYVKNSKGKITVEYINPNNQPTIISQLDPNNSFNLSSQSGNFVVKYNDKIKIINPYDCYSFDETYLSQGYFYVTGNNVEYAFTNSMYILTNGYSCKAYLITGLEEDGSTYLAKILESMAIEPVGLPVSENFAVPEDCDIIIMNGPQNDISEKMYVELSAFVKRGGKLFVAVDFNVINVTEKYERLNKLLNEMNLALDPYLIAENDSGYQLGGYQLDHVVKACDGFSDYAEITLLHSTNARSVRAADVPGNSFKTAPVLKTSENASTTALDQYGNAIESSMVTGKQFYVAMYSAGEGADPAKAFVFGTMNFTSDQYISSYGMNDTNVDFFKSCIRELTSTKQFNTLNVPTRNVENLALDADKSTTAASTVVLVVFMMLIPILLVALAVVVYTKRKNL
ncbi:MAG: GldG family protein [Saccharofermentans sp.]|nr:GldG family protein [Saccharofermentans sp.]